MRDTSPEESCHVMDPDSLLDSGVVLIGVRHLGTLLAVGGLKNLTTDHAELKSMHTVAEARGQGVGRTFGICACGWIEASELGNGSG